MRAEHLLISLTGLFFCFIMVFAGIFLFFAPNIPNFAENLDRHLTAISRMGLALFLLGALFLTFLLMLNKRRYLLLKMGGVSIEDSLIAHFAKESLQPLFPNKLIDCDCVIKRNHIEILANLPFVDLESREETLIECEKRLKVVLQRQCQYDKEFIYNVSFSTK